MIETSIIIPVRNQKKQLLMTLNNLKRQIKKKRDFEIVICDDDSEDGTGEAVRKLRYPIFLKYYINKPPLGRAANRNFGFEKSSGKNLIFIDGDMVPSEGFIEAMLEDSEKNTVKVGGIKMPPTETPDRFESYFYSRARYNTSTKGDTLPGRILSSGNFMISREIFIKVGGFDPGFYCWGGEDIDLGLKLDAMGIPIINAPKALTYHYHKKTIKSLADDSYNYGKNTFELLIKKHPEFLKQFPSHLIGVNPRFAFANIIYKPVTFLTINRPALRLAESAVSKFEKFPWPDFIFAYITWGNLGLGYKKRKKMK